MENRFYAALSCLHSVCLLSDDGVLENEEEMLAILHTIFNYVPLITLMSKYEKLI